MNPYKFKEHMIFLKTEFDAFIFSQRKYILNKEIRKVLDLPHCTNSFADSTFHEYPHLLNVFVFPAFPPHHSFKTMK